MEQIAAYTVLARRFRPQTFDDVVGQEQIAQALRNSIRSGRIAHAYLFTGARGVGKTSSARIFAKALNCPASKDAVPCNECEICRGISAGADVDVLEIDGASNRGIDDIRQLRSNVNVKSMRSPYKVYIIDEVHMLTKEAFNALLKTLEEPPPNVKFIFCTTEPNKVPDTILSRCQRFDFGVIATDQIAGRLSEIAASEGILVDQDAVELVARRAAGSMRDSQSLFDQLLAFGAEHIVVDDVHRLLGTAPDERLFGLFEAIAREDRTAVLEGLDLALAEGCQLGSLAEQILTFLRDLMVMSAGATSIALMSISDSARPRVAELASTFGLRKISAALQILADCRARMQRTTYGRPLLELALVRMTLLGELNQIATVLEQGGSSPPAAAPARPAMMQRPSPSAAMRRELPSAVDAKKKELTSPAVPTPPTAPVTPVAPVSVAPVVVPSAPFFQETSKPVVEKQVTEQKPAVRMSMEQLATDDGWEQLLRLLPEQMVNHLRKSHERAISGPNALAVLFGPNYFLSKSYCERSEIVAQIGNAATELVGSTVHILIRAAAAPAVPTAAQPAQSAKALTRNSSGRRPVSTTQDDPFVQTAVAIFGGTVAEVRESLVAAPETAGSN